MCAEGLAPVLIGACILSCPTTWTGIYVSDSFWGNNLRGLYRFCLARGAHVSRGHGQTSDPPWAEPVGELLMGLLQLECYTTSLHRYEAKFRYGSLQNPETPTPVRLVIIYIHPEIGGSGRKIHPGPRGFL